MNEPSVTVGRIDLGPTEPRHLSQTEQRIMDAALRNSVRLVEEPKPPDSLLVLMAEAMLDPSLRKTLVHEGIAYPSGTLASGNEVRQEVLRRALAAAANHGWELRKVSP